MTGHGTAASGRMRPGWPHGHGSSLPRGGFCEAGEPGARHPGPRAARHASGGPGIPLSTGRTGRSRSGTASPPGTARRAGPRSGIAGGGARPEVEGRTPRDEAAGHLWSIARRAAQDAGRDPDALKTAMRINLEPGTSVDSLAGKLTRFAESGIDEAFVDAFAVFPSLDQMLDFASQLIARTPRL